MDRMARMFGMAVLALLAGGPAGAAVTVMGEGAAAVCSAAALAGEASDEHLAACNQAVLEATPEYRPGTYVNRGVLLLRRKQYDAARADFDAAETLRPDFGEAVVNRGASFVAERRYIEGLIEIDRGLAMGPEEPEKAYFNRALANEGLDDKKAAYLDYMKALELAPDWEPPLQKMQGLTRDNPGLAEKAP